MINSIKKVFLKASICVFKFRELPLELSFPSTVYIYTTENLAKYRIYQSRIVVTEKGRVNILIYLIKKKNILMLGKFIVTYNCKKNVIHIMYVNNFHFN